MAKIKAAPAAQPGQKHTDGIDLGGGAHSRSSASLPNQPINDPFYYAVHPQRWQVLQGKIVPVLLRLEASPGCNGATEHSRGGVVETAINRGLILLTGTAEYLVRHQVTPGNGSSGWHYHDRWTRLINGSDAVRPDLDGFVAWLESLTARGIVPAPDSGSLEVLAGKLRANISRRGVGARVEDIAALEIVAAHIEEHDAGEGEAFELGAA